MSNLIGNALKYGAREAAVIVTLTSTTDSVRISVQNVGAPIPMDRRGSLFEPMVQGRPSDVDASGAFRGLGLGLYIAREVVVAHGGTLDVDSDAVNGTTFTAVLPRC